MDEDGCELAHPQRVLRNLDQGQLPWMSSGRRRTNWLVGTLTLWNLLGAYEEDGENPLQETVCSTATKLKSILGQNLVLDPPCTVVPWGLTRRIPFPTSCSGRRKRA